MIVLSFSCFVPGASAALLVDGHLVAASAESRFSRVPGETAFPERAIAFCLERGRMLTGRSVDRVACVDRVEIGPPGPRTPLAELRSAVSGWTDRQSLRRRVRAMVDVRSEQIAFVDSLRAHAANAFLASPFADASIVVVDGQGDQTVTATGFGAGAAFDLEAVARQDVDGPIMARIVADLAHHTECARVCLAGSRAADPCLVAHVVKSGSVADLFVPPALDGGGAALGAGLYVHHLVTGAPRAFTLEHPYWGHALERMEVLETAGASGLVWAECDEEELLTRTAALLTAGHLVAWAHEAAAFAPRALGNRSVLCDATHADAIGRAPSIGDAPEERSAWTLAVPVERLGQIFETVSPAFASAARFGGVAGRPRPEVADRLAMPTHLDGTVTAHAVMRETNPRFHALLERVGAQGVLPALAQTALTPPGEAPANSAADALRAFRACKVDALVLDQVVMINDLVL